MLEVKGMPILVDEMEILYTIRDQVLQQQGREILHKIKRSGNNIMVCCPVHNDGQERKPSCGISIVKRKDYPPGTWNCFDASVKVITYNGTKQIKDLIGKPVKVLNGLGQWEETVFKNYGKQKLYELNLTRDGHKKQILVTGNHLWLRKHYTKWCETVKLKPKNQIMSVKPEKVLLNIIPEAVRHGFIYGDGSQVSKNCYRIDFCTEQKQILMDSYFKDCKDQKDRPSLRYPGKWVLAPEGINYKELPITNNQDYLYSFIVGWFAADGNVTKHTCSLSSMKESDIDFLINTLPKLGIAHFGKRYQKREANKTYCNHETVIWNLTFVTSTLPDSFFIREHKQIINNNKNFDRLRWTVESVKETNIFTDVYCCQTTTESFVLEDFILSHNCFACGEKGPFELFVSKCFGRDDMAFGTKWLLENFVTGESYERPTIPIDIGRFDILKRKEKKIEYVTEEELASYRFYHPYMWQRKLTPEIVEKYDVGYQKDYRLPIKKEDGTIEYGNPVECLTFPVRDKNGNCLFVSRRAIYNKNFFLPPEIEKPVYGIYELPPGADDVIICESVFNALTCVAYGRSALAMFGTGDDLQYKVLNSLPIRHYILGLDPDKAGNKGTWKLKTHLKNKLLTKLVIPPGKDINDLSYEEFIGLKEIYI